MLTLYYATATFLQSWRIKNVCNKIAQQLAQQASVSFYTLPTAAEDGFVPALATSELCVNRNAAKVSEILWLHGNQRGCCLCPMQTIRIMPWISFPETPCLVPFVHTHSPGELLEQLKSEKWILHLLLETELQPCYNNGRNADYVKIEDYGKLIAWKIDSHLAILVETNIEHFTKFLISTFIQNNYLINDQLPLLRIESIQYEETPQPFEMLCSHRRKPTRAAIQTSDDEWKKHLEDLRALGVLAHQATEFEQNKNRSAEGKAGTTSGATSSPGAVKPDLIPHEKKTNEKTATTSVAKPVAKAAPSTEKKSPNRQESIGGGEKSVKVVKIEATSTSPLGKMKAKPTEIKKPGASLTESGRFKMAKVSDSNASQNLMKSPPPAETNIPPEMNVTPTKDAQAKSIIKPNEKETASTSAATEMESPEKPKIVEQPTPTKTSHTKEAISALPTSSSSSSPTPAQAKSPLSNGTAKRPSLKRNKGSLRESKPLNILVYSEGVSARESAVATLKEILERDMYTIYPLTPQQATEKYWLDNTALLVVCGSVSNSIGELLVDYFLHGGKVLSLCSDILHFVLPTYRTAEVREHELVQFSYDKWQKIKMMHHIFCYQPSPVKKNFSTDSDDSGHQAGAKKSSIELKDLHGDVHSLDVKVLGTEETWNTPSLLVANNVKSGGRAVFSQVHLEANPSQFEMEESKYVILKENEKIRLEIFSDLLNKHLDVSIQQLSGSGDAKLKCVYQQAYFLGHHEAKFELLEKLKENSGANNVITTSKLTMIFCGKNENPPSADTNVLPILIHSCPDDFSTVEYFDDLKTKYLGRLMIYAPIVSSSMNVINELELTNGIAVLARQQTEGVGRSANQWISPLGCAMFSIQLHISLDTPLGSRLPLIQHLIGAAVVNSLKAHPSYKVLDIGLKWPNDIYANHINKIGGLVVRTSIVNKQVIINVGCGVNLDNVKPTTCINELIRDYNRANKQQLPLLKYEEFIAIIFNEIERLLEVVQGGDFQQFHDLYYRLWLHNDQTIVICDKDGKKKEAKVIGIDDYGYLKVKTSTAVETVQPDGNSFDMLQGLIVPKFN